MIRPANLRWRIYGALTIGTNLVIRDQMCLIVHGDLTLEERDGEVIAIVTPVPWTRLVKNAVRRLRYWLADQVSP